MADRSIRELDTNFAACEEAEGLQWFDIRDLGVEGRGFAETAAYYDRLPAAAEGVVRPPVWALQRYCAGMCVRFVTDAPAIGVRWHLYRAELAMPHMCATGVSGIDLYVLENGAYRWCGAGRPEKFPLNQAQFDVATFPGTREFILYLPLYNGVESCRVGVAPGSRLQTAPGWAGGEHRPICFYGTSIVQGGCAPRSGLAYPAIVARRLQRPHLNLGFSGNGQSEPEIAELLAQLDPSVYVLDAIPNMSAAWVSERIEPFVRVLRRAHPETPIVLVESIIRRAVSAANADDPTNPNNQQNACLQAAYRSLLDAGVGGLHYVPGRDLLGNDFEGTVDGAHPTDVGFLRMADIFERVLRPLV